MIKNVWFKLSVLLTFLDLMFALNITSSRFNIFRGYKITQGTPLINITSIAQFGEWTLAFRAQRGINSAFYDLWITNGLQDDHPLNNDFPMECYRMDYYGSCKRHFRSSLLDAWRNIDQVNVSLYANGSRVAHMIFDGTNTDRESWYSRATVLESSWSSLKNDSSVTEFIFRGSRCRENKNADLRRRMTIASFGYCSNDSAYFMVIDKDADDCSDTWSLPITDYPVFVYSASNRMASLNAQPTGE
nr:hypothetical protein BgiMline_023934 [Biomphalaria glabrata]